MSSRILARIALFAAIYALLTVLPPFNAVGYGPVQVRISEALTVFPFLFPWAIWGLYLGCILANLGSPFIVWDLTLGALATLLAAVLTRKMPRAYLVPLPPVVMNALIVSYYVARFSELPYGLCALYIAAGEVVACYGLGYPLLMYLKRNAKVREVIGGEKAEPASAR